jgi:hypothetical protein
MITPEIIGEALRRMGATHIVTVDFDLTGDPVGGTLLAEDRRLWERLAKEINDIQKEKS